MWYPYTIFQVFFTVAVAWEARYYGDNKKVVPYEAYGVCGDRDRNKYLKLVSRFTNGI